VVLFFSSKKGQQSNISFYFWKTNFDAGDAVSKTLKENNVKKLYVRYFDVDKEPGQSEAKPVSPIVFNDLIKSYNIIPVIYIKKRVFENTDSNSLPALAKKYSKQLQVVKSECYVTKPAFYTNDKNVEAMKSFLQKNDMTDYEKLCRSLYGKNLNDLYDYQGIRLAYNDKIEQAIPAVEKSGEKGTMEFAGNPFNTRINDCLECDHELYKGTPYTKLILLKKMKEMEANVQTGKDVYSNALLLGNAFYNLSYYGNARDFYLSSIPGSFQSSSNSLDSTFKNFLLSMKVATGYYQKALAATVTKEQKAKCIYMLAKCERNEWYNKNVFNTDDYFYRSKMVDLKAINSFKMLQQYADTKYYQVILKECGYFRQFIKAN